MSLKEAKGVAAGMEGGEMVENLDLLRAIMNDYEMVLMKLKELEDHIVVLTNENGALRGKLQDFTIELQTN